MNENMNVKPVAVEEENVLFGVIGAFLFSLVGGALYIVLGLIGFIASISGLVTVVCAIKGYSFFAKKESKKGIIISAVISVLVLVIAWYLGLCMDLVNAYEEWYALGEVDFVPTIFEALGFGYLFLPDVPAYFGDLALSLVFGVIGGWSYVATALKRQKAMAAATAGEVESSAEETKE